MNNSVFEETDHPIWGAIVSVFPLVEIKAGMELFVNYGYNSKNFPEDYPWYWKMKLAHEHEAIVPKNKKRSKNKKMLKKNRC